MTQCTTVCPTMLQQPVEEPFWKENVPFFQQLSRRELDMFPGHPWTHGWKYTTVICDSQLYMQYLHKQFTQVSPTRHMFSHASLPQKLLLQRQLVVL